jgi:hypothetical protein
MYILPTPSCSVMPTHPSRTSLHVSNGLTQELLGGEENLRTQHDLWTVIRILHVKRFILH